MGLVPKRTDIADRALHHERRIQFQEIRRQSVGVHTVTHTLLWPGEIIAGEYVPPLIVEVDPLGDTPETKELISVGHVLRLGTATLNWGVNGSLVSLPQTLADGDQIRPAIASVAGAQDLSAYVTIRITPGG